jgi:hypothetical protein
MYTLNKFTVLLVLVFFVIGCSSKKVSYDQKIEAPLSNNTLAFDLYAYKQDTSIVIATSKGTLIKIDPNTFTYANGAIVYNQIQIKVREMHTANDIFKSGIPMSVDAARNNFLQSGGMLEIRAFDNTEELKIADGKSIDIELANFSPANGFSLFYLQGNENWKVNDTFNLKKNERKANALNKIVNLLKQPFKKKSSLVNDNYLIVANLKEVPHLKAFQNQNWKILDGTNPEIVEKCMRFSWDDVVVTPIKNKKNIYNLAFTRSIMVQGSGYDTISLNVQATPSYTSDTSFTKQLDEYNKAIVRLNDEKIRLQAEADMVSSFQIRQLGIWNIDKIMNNEDLVKYSLKFDFEKQIDPLVNHVKLFVLYEEDNSVVYYLPQDWDKVRLSKTKRTSLVAVLPNNKVAFVDSKSVNAMVKQGSSNIFFNTLEQPASSFK